MQTRREVLSLLPQCFTDSKLLQANAGNHKLLLTGFTSFFPLCEEATTARYWITFLVFSVFPAPDSPLGDRVEVRTMKGGNITKDMWEEWES